MGNWLSYTVACNLILIIMYIVFRLLLSSEKQPAFNRCAILGSFLVAAILPLIDYFSLKGTGHGNILIERLLITDIHATSNEVAAPLNVSIIKSFAIIYLIGVLTTLTITVINLTKTFLLIKRGRKVNVNGHEIILVDQKIIPCSFFNKAVMSKVDFDSAAKMIILSHEMAHIKYHHSYDLTVANIFCIIMWYNPAVWFMTSELRATHEYEADAEVLKSGQPKREYQYTILKKAIGRSFPVLANSLNHSNLKKRITMMQKSNSSKSRRARVLALIPAAALGLAVINTPLVSNALERLSDSSMEVFLSHKDSENLSINNHAENSAVGTTPDDKEAVKAAQSMPEFPGGEAAMFKFLADNLKFPESEKNRPEGKYRVVVTFEVKVDGKIGDIKIVRSQGEAFDNEAIRVVRQFPDFKPGTVDGKPVNIYYTFPVCFTIQGDTKTDSAK